MSIVGVAASPPPTKRESHAASNFGRTFAFDFRQEVDLHTITPFAAIVPTSDLLKANRQTEKAFSALETLTKTTDEQDSVLAPFTLNSHNHAILASWIKSCTV